MSSQLGGSWVVISGVISRVALGITHIRELITPFITAHEPPSKRSRTGIPEMTLTGILDEPSHRAMGCCRFLHSEGFSGFRLARIDLGPLRV